MKTIISPLKEQLENEFNYYLNDFYTETFNEEHVYGYENLEEFENYLKTVDIDNLDIKWLANASILHFDYAIFKNEQDKKEEALEHLSKSLQYGYLSLDYGSKACSCFKDKSPFIIQNKAVFIMSNLLLTNNIKEFEITANHLIDSLNGKSCIIKKGYKDSSISWMILKLYSLFFDKEINLHEVLQPKLQSPFKEVIKNYNTTDVNEVEKLIYFLCDTHISIAKENYEIHYEEQFGEERDYNGSKYKELFIVGLYQLPFEVFVWLKLRELKGLENPDLNNLHPLLNTNISQLYLSLEKVDLDKNLIYANKLIEKLKSDYDLK